MLAKFKEFVKEYQADIILLIGVILISLLSFALGYIIAKQEEKEPIKFEMTNDKFLISNQIPSPKSQIGLLGNWDLFRSIRLIRN